jgi:hypothetical protein
MAVREWLRMQEPDFYRDEIFKLLPRWDKCIRVLGNYAKKNGTSVSYINVVMTSQLIFMTW